MFNDIKVGDKVIVKSYNNTYRDLAYYKGTVVSVGDDSITVYFAVPTINLTNITLHGLLRETSHVCAKKPPSHKINVLEL